MKIKLINLEKKKIDNLIGIKPIKMKKDKYEIIINSPIKISFQCKFYAKFIKDLNITNNNTNIDIKQIPQDGFLFSSNICSSNPTNISFKPVDLCSRVFIKDIQIINLVQMNLVPISWDNIYIINLARRPERKEEMIKKLEQNNITQYEFIEAIDGSESNILEQFNKLKSNSNFPIITSGHYACLLSHINAIKKAKENNYLNIMILEDDIIFCGNFIDKIKNITIPEYDMIYLGGISSKIKIFMNNWGKVNKIMGAYAYVLNKSIFDDVLEQLEKIEDYVDLFYLKKIQPNYRVYILNDLIKTDLTSSDTSHKSKKMVKRLKNINKY